MGLLLWSLTKNLVKACYIPVLGITFNLDLTLKVTEVKNFPWTSIIFVTLSFIRRLYNFFLPYYDKFAEFKIFMEARNFFF